MSTAVAVVLFLARDRVRGLRRRRLRRRVLGPHRRRARAGRAPARRHRPLDRAGVGGQPRLADLHLRRAVDRASRGVRVDHADAVRPADHRGPRHRPARRELRLPQGRRRPSATGAIFGAAFALSSVLVPYCMGAVAGGIASGRVPAGGQAGDPVDSWVNPTSILGGVLAVVLVAVPRRGVPRLGRPAARRRRAWRSTSAAGPSVPASSPRVVAAVGIFVLRADAPTRLRRSDLPGAAAGDPQRRCAASARWCCSRGRRPRRPAPRRRRRRRRRRRLGRRAVAVHAARDPHRLSRPRHRSGTLTALLVAVGLAVVIVVPGFILLYVLDQRSLLPEEGVADVADASFETSAD